MTRTPNLEPFEPEETWHNYGDIDAERHGGRFVRWERDMWHIIETRHPDDLPDGLTEDEHMFDHSWVEPMDVWVDGDPAEGLTDEMKAVLESLGAENYDPDNYPDHPTEYAPEFVDRIEYYVVDLPFHLGETGETDWESDYWGYLDGYGIDPDDL